MAEGYRRRGFLGRVGGAARTTGPSVLRTRTENNHIAPVNRCPGSALMPSHLLSVKKKLTKKRSTRTYYILPWERCQPEAPGESVEERLAISYISP